MSSNTLTDWSAGETIVPAVPNNIHQALNGDFVGRGATGIPTAGQNLGTAAIPWGTIRATTLVLNGSAVDTSSIVSPANRVISGAVRSTSGSNLPQFLVPAGGASLSFTLDGTPTNLVVAINGTTTTISTDIVKGSLTAAPSTNNTCLVNDTEAADQYDTKLWGSPFHRKSLTVDTMGSEISALVGKWAAFKIAGVSDEYFMAYVKSTTELSNCYRGYFYDSSLAPVKATGFSNNDVITLMKLTAVFVDDDTTTVDVSYNNPVWSFTSPGSPVTGDYWYDLANNTWKRYDGASFQIIGRTFVGWVIQDTTACVAARCQDFYSVYSANNSMSIEVSTTEIVKAQEAHATVNVAGTSVYYGQDLPTWNITTDLAASADMFDATEQASRTYFAFIKQNGDTVISDIFPYWRPDLYGWYHPYNSWRCVGLFRNDGSSNIISAASTENPFNEKTQLEEGNGHGAVATKVRRYSSIVSQTAAITYEDAANPGATFTIAWPGLYQFGINDRAGAGYFTGISLNSSTLTTSITGLTTQEVVLSQYDGSGEADPGTKNVYAKVGDVFRPHDDGTPNDSSAIGSRFYAVRLKEYKK